MELTVSITPEPPRQKHVMQFTIDQSFLPELIVACNRVLREYPIRGNPGLPNA